MLIARPRSLKSNGHRTSKLPMALRQRRAVELHAHQGIVVLAHSFVPVQQVREEENRVVFAHTDKEPQLLEIEDMEHGGVARQREKAGGDRHPVKCR